MWRDIFHVAIKLNPLGKHHYVIAPICYYNALRKFNTDKVYWSLLNKLYLCVVEYDQDCIYKLLNSPVMFHWQFELPFQLVVWLCCSGPSHHKLSPNRSLILMSNEVKDNFKIQLKIIKLFNTTKSLCQWISHSYVETLLGSQQKLMFP